MLKHLELLHTLSRNRSNLLMIPSRHISSLYKQPKAPAGVYLLYYEGNPIGSFELVWKKESLELCTVCILPSYQRQGHGAWIVKQAKGMAGERNISVNRVDSEYTRKLYISAGIQVPT